MHVADEGETFMAVRLVNEFGLARGLNREDARQVRLKLAGLLRSGEMERAMLMVETLAS